MRRIPRHRLVTALLTSFLGDEIPHLSGIMFPQLQNIELDLKTSCYDSTLAIPSGVLSLLSMLKSTPLRRVRARTKWEGCNPDVPWDIDSALSQWEELDDTLFEHEDMEVFDLDFVVRYSNGKAVWTYDDVKAVERASRNLDDCLDQLLPRTKAKRGLRTRVRRESL